MNKTTKKKKKPLTSKQNKAIELVTKHPDKSNAEISRDMIALGASKDTNYLTTTVRRNTGIAEKIAIKREKYQLAVTNRMPKALKVADNHLKSNNLKAAALVMKHALPTQEDIMPRPTTIHINTLNQLQQINLKACEDSLDAIEVKESDKVSDNQ